MSPKLSKLLKLSLSLAPAALVIHCAAAAAVGDLQWQMGELLAGTRVAYAAPRNEKAETPKFEAQVYMSRILRGESVEGGSPSPAQSNGRGYIDSPPPGGDVQASVQNFLSGKPSSTGYVSPSAYIPQAPTPSSTNGGANWR
jgi:hypothetical protein